MAFDELTDAPGLVELLSPGASGPWYFFPMTALSRSVALLVAAGSNEVTPHPEMLGLMMQLAGLIENLAPTSFGMMSGRPREPPRRRPTRSRLRSLSHRRTASEARRRDASAPVQADPRARKSLRLPLSKPATRTLNGRPRPRRNRYAGLPPETAGGNGEAVEFQPPKLVRSSGAPSRLRTSRSR
jgi:hypothetical protein